jgi:hypothetical protein
MKGRGEGSSPNVILVQVLHAEDRLAYTRREPFHLLRTLCQFRR